MWCSKVQQGRQWSRKRWGGTATYDATTKVLALNLTVNGGKFRTMAHIHGPAAHGAGAGVLIDLTTGSSKVQT